MRSSVFDRFKQNGGLLTDESRGPRSLTVAVAEKPAAPPKAPAPVDNFPPASDDEPIESDPAEEESGHHGTLEKPVDLIQNKLIIRLDDGQLYELRKLQNQENQGEEGY